MKFQFLKSLSILGLASLTLASCGSANKSISCDGIKVYDNLEQAQDDGMDRIPLVSFTADQEKFTRGLIYRLFKTATDDEPLKWCTFYSAVEKCEQLKKEHPHKIRVINEIKEFYFREAKFYGIDLEQQFRRKKYG